MSLSEAFDRDVEEAKENLLKKDFFILGPEVVFTRIVASPQTSSTTTTTSETPQVAAEESLDIPPDTPIDFTLPNGKQLSSSDRPFKIYLRIHRILF